MGKKVKFLKPLWWDNLLKDIFSPSCSLCSFSSQYNGLCSFCEEKLSLELRVKEEDGVLSLFVYEKEIRNLILKWKAYRHYYISQPLAYFISLYIPSEVNFIILAPPSVKRRKKEGVDPLEIIGRFLSKKGFFVLSPFYRKGLSQKVLTKEKRKENISHSLFLKKGIDLSFLENKNILILDDLITTGSTINALENFLRSYQPNFILKMTLCRSSNSKY